MMMMMQSSSRAMAVWVVKYCQLAHKRKLISLKVLWVTTLSFIALGNGGDGARPVEDGEWV